MRGSPSVRPAARPATVPIFRDGANCPWQHGRMDFAEVIRRRRMVRRFANRPLPSDAVERILASATRAPSAGFSQGWAFLALTDEADRERFWPFAPNQTKH